ncbi:cell wall-binding repeat-containing protein [Bacillus sp. FJAT-27225]|uniref:cell wall-binding repeat-containing protein n=1 Tax=Bacillus sp. FJAT-27225 TaxID=1743144 RepID=UPI0015865175|nr:cell wall-binding repeat-containing protein [Bacillus sp. FJAT-27225]
MKGKLYLQSIFVVLLLWCFAGEGQAQAQSLPDRIGGKDRFEVAANLAKKWDHAETVVVANYMAFADALTAGPLAYKLDAPILLTHSNELTPTTSAEIARLNPSNVIIVGGTGSVSEAVASSIQALGIPAIERLAGKDRYEVSVNVAQKLGDWNTISVASGLNFPDALSISSYASRNGVPILLTRPTSLPETVSSLIKSRGINQSIIVGGEASVSKQVEALLPNPYRLGGKNRYEVAANIYKEKMPTETVYLATGVSFADALTGSIAAAKENASILLSQPQGTPAETIKIFSENIIEKYVVLGGEGSISEQAVSDIEFNKKSTGPIFYLVPHADDEVLTFGVDILNQLNKQRNVQLILFSEGADSVAREVVNGVYDLESRVFSLAGTRVKCSWHGVYHNPVTEKYLHGYISLKEFGEIRKEDYRLASEALGVKEHHFSQFTFNGAYYRSNIKNVIRSYLAKYPDAQFRSMSWLDAHSPHAMIGTALKEMEDSGEINPLKTAYFVSVYTDRFAKVSIPYPVRTLALTNPASKKALVSSVDVYRDFRPQVGRYASGYHSVRTQFDSVVKETYVKIHY